MNQVQILPATEKLIEKLSRKTNKTKNEIYELMVEKGIINEIGIPIKVGKLQGALNEGKIV